MSFQLECISVIVAIRNRKKKLNIISRQKAVLEAPYDYIASMPSKGVRDQFIDALNDWLHVPDDKVGKIKDAVRVLHNSSLLYV